VLLSHEVDFRILGPLEVWDGDRLLRLGGAKRRAALALLIVNANEVVSTDRLVDELWGDEAPANATAALHNHISRLRKELGAELLATHGWGYALQTAPETIDYHRFERLVTAAQGAAAERAAQLADALSLWRGAPLADLTFERALSHDLARLEERRLVVLEQRIDADLEAGRDTDLVGELEALISENPLREHFRWQLILALYRGGRQAEALAAYRDTREFFSSELGLEPGTKLRELERAILRQDPALDVSARTEVGERSRDLPAELDPATPLLGRSGEMRVLRWAWAQAREGTGGAVFLRGPPGIGKTRLAAELAREVHAEGAPVVYAACGGPAEPAVEQFLRAAQSGEATLLVADDLDLAAEKLTGSVTALVPLLAERRLLFLGTYREEGSALVDALLQGADPSGEARVDVPPLEADDVRSIAALYSAVGFGELPLGDLLEATGGIPAVVHSVARAWSREQASGRLSELASQAAAERQGLRAAERALEESVVELERAEARSDAFADTGGERIVCPFKGLATFRGVDAEYFFGREQLVAEIVARLVGARFVGVIGQSGSGKSSAVLAGVLPALGRGIIPGSEGWRRVVLRPGDRPTDELEAALAGDEEGALVVVDQFEELFTNCPAEEERARFVNALTSLTLSSLTGQHHAVVVLRADYYGRCAAYPELAELLAANQVLVGPMRGPELRQAIELPARRAGLRVEPELVELLVDDVVGEPGGLPLLSTALLELWQGRRGRTLTVESYREKGGVRGAVTRSAEEAYQRLGPEQRGLARSILCRLAVPGASGGAVRRRVSLAELDAERNPEVTRVLGALVRARLLTASEDSVEVAHEALLTEWPRLRAWLEEDAEGRRLQAHLITAAREWEARGRDPEDLYRGARLAAALEWSSGRDFELNESERSFLHESREASQRAVEAERRENRRLRMLLAAVVVLLAGAVIAGAVAFSQRSRARDEARVAGARALANAAESSLGLDPQRSVLLALEAFRRTPDDTATFGEAEQALLDAVGASRSLLQVDGAAGSVSFSPDGRRFASEGINHKAGVWDAATGKRVFRLGRDVTAVDYGSAGSIATAGLDGKARLWDAASGRKVRTLTAGSGLLFAAELGAGDRLLATVNDHGAVIVWDVATGRKLFERRAWRGLPPEYPVADVVSFSADGRLLAAAGAGPGRLAATVWDVPSGSVVLELPVRELHPLDVDLSPDGSRLALALPDGSVELRDVRSGRLRATARGHEGNVWDVEFSPDGRRLATAGNDGLAKVWQIGPGGLRQLQALAGHTAAVEKVAFSPGGSSLVTGSDDGTARVWDISAEGPRGLTELPAASPAFSGGVAFMPDGRHLAASSTDDGSVQISDSASGRRVASLQADRGGLRGIDVSPDGRWIAATEAGAALEVWDEKTGRRLFETTVDRHCRHASGGTACLATQPVFSPDGSALAVGSGDGAVAILDAATGRVRYRLTGDHGRILNVGYSPDGKRLAAASLDGTAEIWDVEGRRLLHTLHPGGDPIADVGFSPDERELVTAAWDGMIRVWDAADGRQLRSWPANQGDLFDLAIAPDGRLATTGDGGGITIWRSVRGEPLVTIPSPGKTAVAFSPNGRQLASSAAVGQEVTVWPIDSAGLLKLARSRVTRALTAAECRRYLGVRRCPK
jgi:WD40 repeat protein/DNA-binding SARP family transcriptional activator